MNRERSPGEQLSLPFTKFERFDFDLFQCGEDQEIVPWLKRTASGETSRNIYLWGQVGTGKSHLLQAACTLATDRGNSTAFIPLGQLDELTPEMLSGLEDHGLVCIDSLDCMESNDDWELALFRLFNDRREKHRPIIFSAGKSPNGINIRMPDLKSRLSWDLVFHLKPVDENTMITALKLRARSRMFDLPDDVINYLVKRVSRDTHTLFNTLDRLDEASLRNKKKITIPFVKSLLEEDGKT